MLEGTFKNHLVQPSSNEQGQHQLHQVAQLNAQPYLECFKGWESIGYLGKQIQCFNILKIKKNLPSV